MSCICPEHHYKDNDGYPRVKYQKRFWRLNRLIYNLLFGDIPEGQVVAHTCNNKGCINPAHLYLTDPKTNSSHAARDGLYRNGNNHPNTKRTTENVLEMWHLYHTDGLTQERIGNLFDITQSRVSECIRRAQKYLSKDNR